MTLTEETASSIEFPKITVCSPAFFNKTKYLSQLHECDLQVLLRLVEYGLDDEDDDLANYLILSLQTDQTVPGIEVQALLVCSSFVNINLEKWNRFRHHGCENRRSDDRVQYFLPGPAARSCSQLWPVHSVSQREILRSKLGFLAQSLWRCVQQSANTDPLWNLFHYRTKLYNNVREIFHVNPF